MRAPLRVLLLSAILLAGLPAGAVFRTAGFSFSGVSNRFITPNGDGRNDNVAFRYSNPFDSAGTVKIYDLRGHLLTTISIVPGATQAVWDARADGEVVATGVYIFVVSVESVVASGAVVVIR